MKVEKEYIISLLESRLLTADHNASEEEDEGGRTCIAMWLDALAEYALHNKPIKFTPDGSEYPNGDLEDYLEQYSDEEEELSGPDVKCTEHSLLKSIWSTDQKFNLIIRASSDQVPPSITVELIDKSIIRDEHLQRVLEKLHSTFENFTSILDTKCLASYIDKVECRDKGEKSSWVAFHSLYFSDHIASVQIGVKSTNTEHLKHSVTLTVINQVYASGMKPYREYMHGRLQTCKSIFGNSERLNHSIGAIDGQSERDLYNELCMDPSTLMLNDHFFQFLDINMKKVLRNAIMSSGPHKKYYPVYDTSTPFIIHGNGMNAVAKLQTGIVNKGQFIKAVLDFQVDGGMVLTGDALNSANNIPTLCADSMTAYVEDTLYGSGSEDTACILKSSSIQLSGLKTSSVQVPDKRKTTFFLHVKYGHIMVVRIRERQSSADLSIYKGFRRIRTGESLDTNETLFKWLKTNISSAFIVAHKDAADLWKDESFRKSELFRSTTWTPLKWKMEDDKLFAFCMGWHHRLGENSVMKVLPSEILRQVTDKQQQPLTSEYVFKFLDEWFYFKGTDRNVYGRVLQLYPLVCTYESVCVACGGLICALHTMDLSCMNCSLPFCERSGL
jgi:hypothetical protein